jgi:hypothetical protein
VLLADSTAQAHVLIASVSCLYVAFVPDPNCPIYTSQETGACAFVLTLNQFCPLNDLST